MYPTNDVDGNELIPRKPRNLSDHNSGHWSLPGPVALSQRMLANSPTQSPGISSGPGLARHKLNSPPLTSQLKFYYHPVPVLGSLS